MSVVKDVITDGAGLINLRRYCTIGQVCCVHPQPVSTIAPTSTAAPTPAPLTGTFYIFYDFHKVIILPCSMVDFLHWSATFINDSISSPCSVT